MIFADFCRNCLFNWYQVVVVERGIELFKVVLCEIIYGLSYADWKEQY